MKKKIVSVPLIALAAAAVLAAVWSVAQTKDDVAADVRKRLRRDNGNAAIRCCEVKSGARRGPVLLQIDLPAGRSCDIKSLSEIPVPFSVVIKGDIKEMPDFANTPIVDLSLYSSGQAWIRRGGDLSEFRHLKSLTLGKIGMEELLKLKLPAGLQSFSADFTGDAELDLAFFAGAEKLENLSLGSFDGTLKLQVPETGLPQISTLLLFGNCTGYEKLVKTVPLKRLIFQSMKIPHRFLRTPEVARIDRLILKDSAVL